jgi:glycosyltransferase involved in cell wall biosynthesis
MNITIAAVTAPSHLNGVSRHAVNLCRALLEESAIRRIHFLVGHWQLSMLAETAQLADPRLRVHPVSPANTSIGRLWWCLSDLPLIASQLDSDLVHLACPMPIRASAFHCPVVLTLHDLYPFEIPANFGAMKSSFARALVRMAARRADAIACVSDSTRAELGSLLPDCAAKACTINNPVAPLAYVGRHPAELPQDMQFLLCVAQHRANKNIPLVLQIFSRALAAKILPPLARLLIVGIEGPETPLIRRTISRLGLKNNVLLLKGLHDAELQWCYQHCIALLAPSFTEGFGLPVAEALMAGSPILCSDIPAFRELADETCRLIPFGPNAVESYCDALRDILVLPRPRPRTLPHLSSRVIGASYLQLYTKIACERNQRFAILAQPKLDIGRADSVGHPGRPVNVNGLSFVEPAVSKSPKSGHNGFND